MIGPDLCTIWLFAVCELNQTYMYTSVVKVSDGQ